MITLPLWLFLALIAVAWVMFAVIAVDLFLHRNDKDDR